MYLKLNHAQFMLVYVIFYSILPAYSDPCPADINKPWSYDYSLSNGPQHWYEKYPTCAGNKQSPIEIETDNVIEALNLQPLQLINYDVPITKGKLSNDGHTVKVEPKDKVKRSAIINGTQYSLKFFDFHWSDCVSSSADHVIDGYPYPFELHFIHKGPGDNMAMVAVLYEESPYENPALNSITNSIEKVLYKNDTEHLKDDINLLDLIDNGCSFYTYNGSQTVPPCAEIFLYAICTRSKYIGAQQLDSFRKIYSIESGHHKEEKNCRITSNARPIQSLAGRTVFLSQ